MLTVTQAFDQLRQNLELTPAEREEASRQQNVVRGNMDKHLGGIQDDRLSGSYRRRTAIRPLNDIDIFLVLDPRAHRDVYPSQTPSVDACLNKIKRALDTAYQNKVPTQLQSRSVNIEFKGTGIGYDLVPAFASSAGFIIPDRDRKAWIQSDPDKHIAACIAANERAGGKLNPLIKMAKQWNVCAGKPKPLRSFHLEVMAYGAFPSAPAGYPEALARQFRFLVDRVLQPCPEPAGIGPNIDQHMTQEERTRAREKLTNAADRAAEALRYDADGNTHKAHAIWRDLLGDAYPAPSTSAK